MNTGVNLALFLTLALGGVLAVGGLGIPGLSATPITFDCLTEAQAFSLISTQAPGEMSPTTNPSCPGDYTGYYTPGPINTSGGGGITSTVISSSTYPASTTSTTSTSTTTLYCGTVPYNPAIQTCETNTQTSSAAVSGSMTTATTSSNQVTISATATGSSTTIQTMRSIGPMTTLQLVGLGLTAFSILGLFIVNRRKAKPSL